MDLPHVDHLAELSELEENDGFVRRHIGPSEVDLTAMLHAIGAATLDDVAGKTIPAAIRSNAALDLPPPIDEAATIAELRALAAQNTTVKSLIGMGYHGTVTPPVVLRNVLENPGWYTAYTPYQAEIAQGRLEALLNFQTMIGDLTGMAIANASLLDEATAAAEAMAMAHATSKSKSNVMAVASDLHPQTLAVLAVRAKPLGITLRVVGPGQGVAGEAFALMLQYPGTTGALRDLSAEIDTAHEVGALAIVATDLLALALLTPPGEMGADVVVGSAQRFGVPMGVGGPHAGFFATRDAFKRAMPGRLVGVSLDAAGQPAMRLALQTREQHIRREKATSNICTAQVLLAVIAGFYAGWHGPDGLRRIARRVSLQARMLADVALRAGLSVRHATFFDTIVVEGAPGLIARAAKAGYNFRRVDDNCDPAGGRARIRFPRPGGVQPASRRTRNAALPEAAGGQGHRAQPQHDPARFLHDETERHGRDDSDHAARFLRHSSVRACGSDCWLPDADPAAGGLAMRRDRILRGVVAAQCRVARRICRPSSHSSMA